MRKIAIAMTVLACVASLSAATWRTSVYSGDFTNTANWVNGVYPSDTGQNAQFSCGQGSGDYAISISDVNLKAKALVANVWTGSSLQLDCADAIFQMPALGQDEGTRDAKAIFLYAGSGRPASGMLSIDQSSTANSVFAFSNALFKASNSDDKNVTLDFTRGYFSFAGADGTDGTVKAQFATGGNVDDGRDPNYGPQDFVRTYTVNLTGVEAVFGIFDWYGKSLTNVLNATNARVSVLGDMTFPSTVYANVDATQTNHANVVSSTLDVGGKLVFAKEGTASADFDDATVSVASDLQASKASSVLFDNGSQVTVGGSVSLGGTASVSIAGGSSVSAVNMGNSPSASDDDDVSIVIDGDGTEVDVSNDLYVGYRGSCAMTVAGGELNVGSYFAFGNSVPGKPVRYVFKQTGGSVVAKYVIACRGVNSTNIEAVVNLDGGEFHANRLYGSRTKVQGYLGTAVLSADGGTYCARTKELDTTYPFIGYFDLAELGPKGLTIRTDYESRIVQSFTNKVGAAGRLILEGGGTIYLGKDTYQSELVSDVANLVFDSGVTTCASRLAVTNGTSVSFASTAALALGGLKLDGGSVATFASTTRLTVDSVSLGDFKVVLSEAFAAGTYPLITVNGVVAQADREAWTISDVYVGRESGKTYNLRCGDYDSASGTTVLSLEVGSGTTPAVTDAEDIATPVDNLVVLGALAFTQAKDYVLTGQGRLRFEDTGAAAVTVASGSQNIDVPTYLAGTLAINVPGGASLEFSKPVVNGGIDKSGTGVLAFGADAASELPAGVKLRDGTWKVDGPGVSSRGAVTIQSPNPSNAVVLATSVDTTVPGMTVLSGALVKTGAGRLTVENANAAMQLYGNWSIHGQLQYGVTVPGGAMDFPADGTPPTKEYSAFNIVEGEIVLRGTGAGAPTSSSQYFSTAEVFVGMRSPLNVAAAPGLAIDHAKVALGGVQRHIFIGEKPANADTLGKANCPYLAISNKSEVTAHGVLIGDNCDTDTTAHIYPRITVDDSSWTLTGNAQSKLVLSGGKTCHTALDVVNGSSLLAGATAVLWKGDAEVLIDGASLFAGTAENSACTFQFGNNAKGTFRVAGGSTLRCTGVVFATGASSLVNDVRFAFDGGYLDPAETTFAFQSPMSGCHVVALDGGLRLAVPEGGTWTLPAMVEGTGPIVACGLGTVALDGVFTNAFAGAGTFSGGTLRGAKVKLAVDDEGAIASDVPTFSGTTYGGRVFVDLGRTAENPIDLAKIRDVTVMRYVGAAPSPAVIKLSGTGHSRAYGVFEAADGQVVLKSVEGGRGMAIVFR